MQGSHRVSRLRRKLRQQEGPPALARPKAVGYVRVSTELQLDGYGPETQEDAIRSFAKSQGYELVSIVADQVSGAVAPLERPGFADVAKLAEHGAFTILLLYKFDRLARDVLHAITSVHMLRDKYGVAIKSVTEPIDDTSTGKLMEGVLAAFAQFDNDCRSDPTRAGMKAALEFARGHLVLRVGEETSNPSDRSPAVCSSPSLT